MTHPSNALQKQREKAFAPAIVAGEEARLLFEARSVACLFQIFGNVQRTMILFMIASRNGVTATDIVRTMEMSLPHAYQHLKRLVAGGWIKPTRRRGAKAYTCSCMEVHLLLMNLLSIANASVSTKNQNQGHDDIQDFRQWQEIKASDRLFRANSSHELGKAQRAMVRELEQQD